MAAAACVAVGGACGGVGGGRRRTPHRQGRRGGCWRWRRRRSSAWCCGEGGVARGCGWVGGWVDREASMLGSSIAVWRHAYPAGAGCWLSYSITPAPCFLLVTTLRPCHRRDARMSLSLCSTCSSRQRLLCGKGRGGAWHTRPSLQPPAPQPPKHCKSFIYAAAPPAAPPLTHRQTHGVSTRLFFSSLSPQN